MWEYKSKIAHAAAFFALQIMLIMDTSALIGQKTWGIFETPITDLRTDLNTSIICIETTDIITKLQW